MKYTTLLILTLTLCGCGQSRSRQPTIKEIVIRDTVFVRDTVIMPTPTKKQANPRVFITYKQLVNGYNVSVTWFPWDGTGEVGHGILQFTHTSEIPKYGSKKQEFYVFNPYFSDFTLDSLARSGHLFHDGDTLSLDYTPPKKGDLIGHNTPFQFLDVDFDGEKELLINEWRCGHRDWNRYDVYKIESYHAEKQAKEPFRDLEDGDVFDFKKKTITQSRTNGAANTTRVVYGYHAIPTIPKLESDKPFVDFHYPIKLDSLYSIDNGHMTIYARQRDKLVLIDEYDFK